jgi:cell division protein FtsI (penicillin-binding protein 3)
LHRRFVGFAVVVTILLLLVVARVVMVQTVQSDQFTGYGDSRRLRRIELPAARGAIFDRNGVELAMSVPSYTVWADPRRMVDKNAALASLDQVLNIDVSRLPALVEQLSSESSEFAYVKRQVDEATAQQIRALELPGIYILDEPRRYLPAGNLARSVVGTTNLEGEGSTGLEAQFDEVLTGTNGYIERERDRQGRAIPAGRHEEVPPKPGTDLVLTLDQRVQYQTEQMLIRTVLETGAKGGMVVVMDTLTGDLLAVANVRRDPTDRAIVTVSSTNSAFVETYEPGSVAKIIAAAGAIEEGKVDLNRSFHIPAKLKVYDAEITDDSFHDPDLTVRGIIAQSSNIGTVLLAREIGSEKLDSYFRAFGFGAETGVGVPGEASGLLPSWKKWSGTQRATIAYGQGVGVTAVQLTAAMNTIANGGTYVAPKLVRSTIDRTGTEQMIPASPTHQVIRPEVAADMTTVLRDVVCVGTAKTTARLPGYQVAGKTGTAYKAQAAYPGQTDGYVDAQGQRHYYASFAGFVPADAPRVTVLVSIDEPEFEQRFGYQSAAPLFTEVAGEALRALKVPPSGTVGC